MKNLSESKKKTCYSTFPLNSIFFLFFLSQPDLAEETMSTDVMELKEGIYQQVKAKQIFRALLRLSF